MSESNVWPSWGLSHQGNVRSVNEDAYVSLPQVGVWAVADGMGGHYAGDVASRMVVQSLEMIERRHGLEESIRQVERRIGQTNTKLSEDMTLKIGNEIMGTTIVSVVQDGKQCACLWAGDSRLYVYRSGYLYQISRDHSLVQEMVDCGELTEELARVHPQSHVITRAVGVKGDFELEVAEFEVYSGDVLLLCSDGLHGELSHSEIRNLIGEHEGARLANALVNAVLEKKGKDNITVNVIEVP